MTVDALRRSPLLGGLPDAALERLAAGATTVSLGADQVLIAEGDPADAMYLIVDGKLEVTKRVGDADVPIGHCGPGEPVGEFALVDARPRSATVRTLSDCRLLRVDGQAFRDLLAEPTVVRRLLVATTRRLEEREVAMRQHARMATLGTLTAGLLHELNNPAAALLRGAGRLAEADDWLAAGARLEPTAAAAALALAAGRRPPAPEPADPLASATAEEELQRWLEEHGVDPAWTLAAPLTATDVTVDELEGLAESAGPRQLDAAVRVVAASRQLAGLAAHLRAAAARVSDVVEAVRSYARHDQAPVQELSVTDGLEAALTLLRHRLAAGVRVRRDYAAELPRVQGYPGELNSVWTNLVDNALDAIGGRGELVLGARADGEEVVVEVADDGPGIPADIRDRIFDPFFTTKPVGQGAGLGLATAHAIVTRQHRGRLTVESRPGRTVFTVRLPRRRGAA